MTEHVASISHRHPSVSWEYLLPSTAESAAHARRHVRYAVGHRTDGEKLRDIELVVTELVTNAVRHGPGGLITLRVVVGADGSVSGEVVDQGDGVVAIREREANEPGGLGLPLVDYLTSNWGVYPGSTHVWFRFEDAARPVRR
jgi:anti-sigma regulatory factor (Ser/Thr protein kinase)